MATARRKNARTYYPMDTNFNGLDASVAPAPQTTSSGGGTCASIPAAGPATERLQKNS